MSRNLKDQEKRGTCIIVGVGPGLGQALASRFAHGGLKIGLIARTPEKLEQFENSLRAEGTEVRSFSADAADPHTMLMAFSHAQGALGDPTVLIYNAASIVSTPVLSLSFDALLKSLQTNVAGALFAAQQVAPIMSGNGSGTILFTGGGPAIHPSASATALSIGKAALRNLSFCLAEVLEPHGVHVATITIMGTIQSGTHFDPERIAETYWQLYMQPADHWERELIYA